MSRIKVEELLKEYAINEYARETLAPFIAISSTKENHLYEDLGLSSREEMGEFMKKYFPELAKDKPKEIRWKKFLYDRVNSIAPACYGCLDSHDCFKCDVLN